MSASPTSTRRHRVRQSTRSETQASATTGSTHGTAVVILTNQTPADDSAPATSHQALPPSNQRQAIKTQPTANAVAMNSIKTTVPNSAPYGTASNNTNAT